MTTLALAVASAVATFAVRVAPIIFCPGKRLGVDHWYWLLFVEHLRRQRRIPVRIDRYVLEPDESWYPPLYPIFLACLPDRLLKGHAHLVSPAIDAVHAGIVAALGTALGGPTVGAVAASLFALTPTLEARAVELNPRIPGALLLTLTLVATFLAERDGGAWLAAACLGGAAILLHHKMTAQCLAGLWILRAVWTATWLHVGLLGGSVAAALVFSGGFWAKVLYAHWDIVAFQHRNRRYLCAHEYETSPIYGDPDSQSGRLHRAGWRGFAEHLARLAAHHPVAHLLVLFVVAGVAPAADPAVEYLVFLTLGVLVIAYATTFVPVLRCVGAGYMYLPFVAAPAALLAAAALPPAWLGVAFVSALGGMAVAVRKIREANVLRGLDPDLERAIAWLKDAPGEPVLCVPFSASEAAAYLSGKKIAWGCHSHGFRMIEPYHPVMRRRFAEMVRDVGIRWVLYHRPFWGAAGRALGEVAHAVRAEFGDWVVVEIVAGKESP